VFIALLSAEKKKMATLLSQCTTCVLSIYLLHSIPPLPRRWIAIILGGKVGTGPVGVSHPIK
jgi:hypothetical protein